MSNEDHNQFMELLNKQQTSYDKIKSVQSNYKKDSASRKTVDYLNKRVEALQSLWDEFSANHGMMKKHESDYKEHSYFKDNIFHLTRCMFEETMQSMTQLRNELLNEPGFSGIVKSKTSDVHVTPKFNTSGNSFGEETDNNLSTLIRKQMCNFNAFERAVSKINLEDLKGKWQIQDKLNVLESKWESIDKIHWEINYLLQGSDEEYTQRFEHWEQIYDELKEDLGRKMFETSHYEKSTPRVELPEFNGNYNSWISFRDLFLEMIHNNPTLNKAQKMKHLKKGQLVLVKENNLPPGKWAMGRVMELHPGTDKLVRVVTLKTQNGVLKRPITKLAPLPINKCDNVNDPKRGSSEPEDNCNQRKKRVKESQKRINSLFMVFLVAFTTLSGVRAEPVQHYQITQLSGHRPLYFDPAGNVQLIHDEWKLLVYYNMTTFWQCTSKVENFINHLSQLCEAIPIEPCHATIHQLKFEMNQIYEYNELLSSQHLQRNRRGYVDGVGNLARTLFGVLDSDFANKYAQDINNIKTNENYLLKLIRNQTFIIEAENNIIKKNEHFVKTQLETIQRYMSENRLYETTIENRFQIMKMMNDINAGAVTASLLLSTLRGSQQMLLDALADIYRGHLDRNIFTPKQLSEQLNYIAGVISKKLTLPLKNKSEQNLQNIYKLIYVKARLTEQYLLFELHIPLLSDDEYALYNNIPILTRKQNTAGQCQQIQTRTKYIGVNFVKNTYIQIEETDLQQCTALMEDHYVCHAYTSIHNMHGATASCEAKLLSQHTENIICDWVSGQCSDQWIKLQRPNIWLYNCPTECRARVVCDNHISTTSLTSSGLLALGQDCVIQHKDVTIYSHNTYNSKINLGMMALEVPLIDSPNELWNIGQHSRIILPTQNLSADHAELERKINIQKAREMLPEPLTIHDIGNYTLSSLIVGGIIISLILWRLRKYLISKKKNTAIKRNEDMELAEISDTAAPGVSPNEFKL